MKTNQIIVGQHYRHKLHPDTLYLGVGLAPYDTDAFKKKSYIKKCLVAVSNSDTPSLVGEIVHLNHPDNVATWSKLFYKA